LAARQNEEFYRVTDTGVATDDGQEGKEDVEKDAGNDVFSTQVATFFHSPSSCNSIIKSDMARAQAKGGIANSGRTIMACFFC
jgi:hypothetical protein